MLKPTLKHLAAHLHPRSLKIKVAGELEVFRSADDFERFLQARQEMPVRRAEEFAALDQRGLRREMRKALQAHQNAADVMVHAAETGESIAHLWRRLDISKVADDHDWPSILFSVGNAGEGNVDYQRIALTHYIRYLDTRRQMLDGLHHSQYGHEVQPSGAPVQEGHAAGPAASPADGQPDGYTRLPPRHVINVDMQDRPDITVMLGTNRFHLGREGTHFVLAAGAAGSYSLKTGRNIIGRSSQCDVRLDKAHADVSRQHLIVEISDSKRVSLMDVSSRGTYVRPQFLEEAGADNTGEGVR